MSLPAWILPIADADQVPGAMPVRSVWEHWARHAYRDEAATAVMGLRGRMLGTVTPQAVIRYVRETERRVEIYHLWPAYTYVVPILPDPIAEAVHDTPVARIPLQRGITLTLEWPADWDTAARALAASPVPVVWVCEAGRGLVGKVTARSLWEAR
jgi:hypothetical protein